MSAGPPFSVLELPQLIAHRGASRNAPENTLAAVRLAWKEGADGVEADFHMTKDGEVVCIHDNTTRRTAGDDLSVTDSTLAELRELDYGAWKDPRFTGENIPTLSEILDEIPPWKWFFIEIKDTARIVPPIAAVLVGRSVARERVVLMSFSKEVVKSCRKILPLFKSCLISSLEEFSKPSMPERYLADLEEVGSQGLIYKESAPVGAGFLRLARGPQGLLLAWTPDTVEAALRATALGADFIGTNRPGGLRRELLRDPGVVRWPPPGRR